MGQSLLGQSMHMEKYLEYSKKEAFFPPYLFLFNSIIFLSTYIVNLPFKKSSSWKLTGSI